MELTAVCLRQRSLLRVLLSHPQSKAHCVSQAHQFAKAGWSVLPGLPALPPQGYANRQAQLFTGVLGLKPRSSCLSAGT